MRLLRECLWTLGRALTLGVYASAITLAMMLSDRPVAVRAATGAGWVVCLAALGWCVVRRAIAAQAEERGWARQRAGLCPNCAYSVARGARTCPECGANARMPPL